MKYQHLNDIPEYRAAQERLVELQLKRAGAEKHFSEIQQQINLYDELQMGGVSNKMQRTAASEAGKFAAPPDQAIRILTGNSVDTVTEKARHLTTAPSEIEVEKRISREKLIQQLNDAASEVRVLARAIELQRQLVASAVSTASRLILEAANPEYRKLVRAFLDEIQRMEQAESAMRDFWAGFYDEGCEGVDLYLPQLPRTGIGRKSEPGSRFNRIFEEAGQHGMVVIRKVA